MSSYSYRKADRDVVSAVREIMPFANEKHVPVLPIMVDIDLDGKFQEIFGDLQYLVPRNRDATAIPI